MKRSIWNLICGLSLLLCVSTAALWMRSYWAGDAARWNVRSIGGVAFWSSKGRFMLEIYADKRGMLEGFQHIAQAPWDFDEQSRRWLANYHNWLGFGFGTGYPGEHPLIVPYWFPFLLSGIVAVFLFRRGKSSERKIPGRCIKCGYDLRASKDRCPECGTAITAGAKT